MVNNLNRTGRMVAVVLVLTALNTVLAFTQLPTAAILGTVKDSSGGVLPDTAVTVRNLQTGLTRTERTGAAYLSAHKVDGVRERIEAAGATLLYLPPCLPDFPRTEKAWSKIKPHLRKAKARTLELLEQAVAEALQSVSSQGAAGWFRHCGHAIQ